MGSISTSTGWMTSFIYEQDLTSYYMNNILSGSFKPGVYNANIALVENSNGIYLSIKRGTTLLFSNDYLEDSVTGIGTRRNFNNINNSMFNNPSNTDSENLVLIKCVANNDIFQKIIGKEDESFFGDDRPKTLYLFAYMEYIKKPSLTGEQASVPQFILTKPSNNIRNTSEMDTKNYIYNTIFPIYKYDGNVLAETEDLKYVVPDGSLNYSFETAVRYKRNRNFLMLGSIIECLDPKTFTYVNNKSQWTQYHTFTGRGIPEYRHNMNSDKNIMLPDFIPFVKENRPLVGIPYQTAFIDMPNSMVKNTIINRRIDKQDQPLKVKDNCWEFCYDSCVDTNINFNYNKYYNYITKAFDLDDKLDFSITPEEAEIFENSSAIVIDYIYGTVCNEKTGDDSVNIYKFNSNLSGIKYSSYRNIYKPDSLIDMLDVLFHTSDLSWYDSTNSEFTNAKVLPLDVCNKNIERLFTLLQNKNMWPTLVDKLRIDNEQYPEETTDIIPIAISFRVFVCSRDYDDISLYYPNLVKVSESPAIWSVSYSNSAYTIDTNNTVCYFDLTDKMSNINKISTCSENIYNLIPVIY